MAIRILQYPELLEKLGYKPNPNQPNAGRSTIALWIKTQGFPEPIPLGGRRVGFNESEVDAWILGRREAKADAISEKSKAGRKAANARFAKVAAAGG
ncbi:helix-turn-helix transcriptional regulator [Burkholderia ubonensis]|uniref:helix-turn-helix transcriptional regulator n=1 Tax=Burkholderia ubonensis TaxID=101571 RepID=UPI0009B3AFC6|nr:AlpA family phage regulatory protein [Burkholderia ubonensis]